MRGSTITEPAPPLDHPPPQHSSSARLRCARLLYLRRASGPRGTC